MALKIILAIFVFSLMILMHEFGHFIFARLFGVKVTEFAMGMGPKLFSFKSKKTEYSLRLFPIGGFCNMVGEEEYVDDKDAFCNKPIWQRLIILAAGAVMNLFFGIIIMCIIVTASPAIGGRTVAVFNENATSNFQGGLQVNDEIIKIGNSHIFTTSDISYFIFHDGIKPVNITVIRNGEKILLNDVKFSSGVESGIEIGIMDFKVLPVEKNFKTVVYNSFFDSFSNIRMIYSSLIDLVTGRYGMKAVSGPVGVTSAIGEAANAGIISLLYMISFISMNLGIFNLLPLPALDGGHIFFLIVELIRGKPIKPEHESYVHFAGFVILILLMIFATVNDVMSLIGGNV